MYTVALHVFSHESGCWQDIHEVNEEHLTLEEAKAFCQKHLDELVASIIGEDSDNERILSEMAERPAVKMERELSRRLGRKPTDGELLDELRRQLDR